MPIRIRARVDYTGCAPAPKPIVLKEPKYRAERVTWMPRAKGLLWTPAEKELLRKLLDEGYSVRQAAKEFPNRTHTAVAHVVCDMGLKCKR